MSLVKDEVLSNQSRQQSELLSKHSRLKNSGYNVIGSQRSISKSGISVSHFEKSSNASTVTDGLLVTPARAHHLRKITDLHVPANDSE